MKIVFILMCGLYFTNLYTSLALNDWERLWEAAYRFRYLPRVKELLYCKGINPNIFDGGNILMGMVYPFEEVAENEIKILNFLLESGVNPYLQATRGSCKGLNAFDKAKKEKHAQQIIKILENYTFPSLKKIAIRKVVNLLHQGYNPSLQEIKDQHLLPEELITKIEEFLKTD